MTRMENTLQELEELLKLIKMEREADFDQYKILVQNLPVHQRIEEGFTWYPLQLLNAGYTYGNRAYVIVERTSNFDQPDQFRSGKIVNFFTQQPKAYQPEKTGVIHYLDKNKMKIILNAKDLPDWINGGQLGVDLLFDARTYQEMEKALQKVMEAKGDRLAELRSIILGQKPPRFRKINTNLTLPALNPAQNQAIREILAAQDISIVHGPPGTGKTTTLVHAIQQLCETEKTVLVTAPSNTAVDVLTERLADLSLNVVRIGNISRVDEKIISHTIESRLSSHPESRNIKKVQLEAAEARRKAKRYRRKFGRKEWHERRQLMKEANELSAWAKQLEDRLIETILLQAQVVTCTLVGSMHPFIENHKFRTVVIDEAAQALEPATWIPITKASKVVLAGDPFQLPPTIKSQEARKAGLEITMIEKCIERLPKVSFLNVQYRMHEAIMNFSNQQFYNGLLKAAEQVRYHQLPIENNTPVIFIDTVGCGFDEQINEEYQSRYNVGEFQILCEHLYQLIDAHRLREVELPSIAIISPYREQVIRMTQVVKEDPRLQDIPLTINTIDGFQGQESDVVYITLVRSNRNQNIGFLKDYRRMNVAMTRARQQLIVIGDSATIGTDPFYEAFLDYCEKAGSYQTAWAYMLQG